jgi:hypothetical protein
MSTACSRVGLDLAREFDGLIGWLEARDTYYILRNPAQVLRTGSSPTPNATPIRLLLVENLQLIFPALFEIQTTAVRWLLQCF